MLKSQTRVSRRGRKPSPPALNPRRQPRQQRSADTIAVILEAATQILQTRGLEAFNTNAIAERAGVSIGSLYQYFPGKESILAALHRRYEDQLTATVQQSIASTTSLPLPERLCHAIDALIEAHSQAPILHRLLELCEDTHLLPQTSDQPTRTIQATLRALLRHHRLRLPGITQAQAAEDLLLIARALINRAIVESSNPISPTWRRRIHRAINHYLAP
jgi:AcrR family transcriptional regulator